MGLERAVAEALGSNVERMDRVGGGDVAESFRVALADGRTVFAKTHHDPPADFFTTEAAGLRWLGEAGALPVPDVVAVSDGTSNTVAFLVLAWIDEGSTARADEMQFGTALAQLHRAGAPCFGREDRRPTGSRALPNDPCFDWVEFYATRRLEPLARLAHEQRALPEHALGMLETVTARLDLLAGPAEPAARLHGDLWAGNRLVDSDGYSWLIDPAAHGGHREFDLAMMRLFGGFAPDCFEAYDDAFPLADGWQQRIPLHQLAPLIVHAIKFGGHYGAATEQALTSCLRRID